jgi:cytochrome P450
MSSLPPGHRHFGVVNLVRMSMAPYRFFEESQRRYGDLFSLKLPGQAVTVMCADPEAVKTLTTSGYADVTRFAEGVRFLLGDHAVIFQQDDPHKETRRLMVPPFHGERMRAYGQDMARIADEVLAAFRDGKPRLFHKEMQHITMRVILRCVFGISEEARLSELAWLLTEHLDAMTKPWNYAATLVVGGPRVRDFLRARSGRARRIDEMLAEEIARCRALDEKSLSERTDILAMLVAARYEDGSAMSDEVLRDHLMTLLIGGHETTATALTWAVDGALRHPGTMEKMREEVDRVMGQDFDPARIKELTYVGAVVNESMRLHPIATAVSRRLKKDMRLGGHDLKAGTIVAPCLYLVQRDARIWPEPDKFRPERFLEGKAPIYHFFPFGAGVWKCLGAQFAEYEMRVVLARLVAQLDLAMVNNDGLSASKPMQRGFTVAPADGLPVRGSARQIGDHAVEEQRHHQDRRQKTGRGADGEVAKAHA